MASTLLVPMGRGTEGNGEESNVSGHLKAAGAGLVRNYATAVTDSNKCGWYMY